MDKKKYQKLINETIMKLYKKRRVICGKMNKISNLEILQPY